MKNEQSLTQRAQKVRQHMRQHVARRLQALVARYQGRTDTDARNAVKAAQEKYTLESMLAKGAKASGAIAIASHIAKATHPDLKVKGVTNLAVDFSKLPQRQELGSHVLAADQSLWDATGDGAYNSAAYELYLLLDTRYEGQTLAAWLLAGDEDVLSAFTVGTNTRELPWLGLLQTKCPVPAVNTRSKQVYWLSTPGQACDDRAYMLLAPLSPASLMHQVYLEIHRNRFDKGNIAAGQAKHDQKAHIGVHRHYPDLAIQNMGGTKPQNISQLNSERRGINYLLSSLPPEWKINEKRLPTQTKSVFEGYFSSRPLVQQAVNALRQFLNSNPPPSMETRQHRKALVDVLVDEMVAMAVELEQRLAPGWTLNDPRFAQLNRDEQHWLDPLRAELPDEDDFAETWLAMEWPDEIGSRFGNWLNARLEGKLQYSEVEFREWKKELLTDEDGFVQQLREQRNRIRAARKGGKP
ncbi:MAG: type I-F CRISPR-associated protein Csy1 [Burkholderiales bacterium]|nr:type I-F CRISPR-associated protein Csy1 [Burkholderiales bacterium]MBK8666599.1 type I-F CRISPR-associated protein Csy1 [Burkholderiales bacterium]